MSRFTQHSAMSPDDGVEIHAVVKWFNLSKGFGFVSPVDGSAEAFLHVSVLNRAGLQDVAEGTGLVCQVNQGPRGPQVMRIVEISSDRPVHSAPPPRPAPPERPISAPSGVEAEMSGTVKWFKPDKGFGFVTADDASKDIFVHKSILRRCGLADLVPGQRVHMRIQDAEKGREATWIVLLG